jgi:branched-chain amino acid transport system ATP-binding protein
MTLLSVRNLCKAFGGNKVVRDVSFDLSAGEIVALIGPNGAGKTTCFNMLNGQLRPDSGRILLKEQQADGIGWQRMPTSSLGRADSRNAIRGHSSQPEAGLGGQDIAGRTPDHIWRQGVGRGFQIAQTFQSMTVQDNARAALLAGNRAVWRFLRPAGAMLTREADALLDRVGLLPLANQSCATLAYGDLKRLELALAMANKPRLLLLDEPTAGMAEEDRRSVMTLVQTLVRDSGCAVLFTEHDIRAVFRVAERILVMDKGALIAEGNAASIQTNPLVRRAYLGDDAEWDI